VKARLTRGNPFAAGSSIDRRAEVIVVEPDGFREFVVTRSPALLKSQTSKALANLRRSPLRHLFDQEASDDVR
jgi:hypothetical protein